MLSKNLKDPIDYSEQKTGKFFNLKPLIIDFIATRHGKIPVVSTKLNIMDYWGAIKVRFNVSRNKYTVKPGLYAIGQPNENAPVLVTANYKLSFDSLRQQLTNRNAWLLVLDTNGINVWCAAGKGTFGTAELVRQISRVQLGQIVNHRELIVPQLSAPGVAAHQVKQATGFQVSFGPIRATDLPAFLDGGKRATPEMRTVRFDLLDRIKVVPVEVVQGLKYVIALSAVFFLLTGLFSGNFTEDQFLTKGIASALLIGLAFVSGTTLTPILLPYIPGSAFAFKGFVVNLLFFSPLVYFNQPNLSLLEKTAWFLIMSAIASFFAMNFTGASTYTSLSGVKKELRIAIPLQAIGFLLGFGLWVTHTLFKLIG